MFCMPAQMRSSSLGTLNPFSGHTPSRASSSGCVGFALFEVQRVAMAHALVHEVHTDRLSVDPRCRGILFWLLLQLPSSHSFRDFTSFSSPNVHCPVLIMKSSYRPGGMVRSPASHCCHARKDACTNSAASVWVSSAHARAPRRASGVGLCFFVLGIGPFHLSKP